LARRWRVRRKRKSKSKEVASGAPSCSRLIRIRMARTLRAAPLGLRIAIRRTGNMRQILPDVLRLRVWTGYFFVSVPVRIDWPEGKLALGQRCLYQTGHGFAEGGCEVPVEGARVNSRQQEMTFVRMFRESNERSGPPAHVVVRMDSKVEVVAGKVTMIWDEGPDVVSISVGGDVWVKVRIDGQEGWIHTPEDLNAVGLFASG
jgi:hypothetical protein